MEQGEARRIASRLRDQGREALAVTRDSLAGRWESTNEWVITEYGRIIVADVVEDWRMSNGYIEGQG